MGTQTGHARQVGGPSVVVGVGASAGGVEALVELVDAIPSSFGGSVLVVLHTSAVGTESLVRVLRQSGTLPVELATDGARLRAGTIYVAPHDRHLTVARDTIRLTDAPPENSYRPSVDTTFASLASLGSLAVGVILSGTLTDGTRGLGALKAAGGQAVVQDPEEAQHAGMIRSAQHAVEIDATLPVRGIAELLASWPGSPAVQFAPRP